MESVLGSNKETGIYRSRYKHELYKLYNESDVVKVIKVRRPRWLGHLSRMQEQKPCRKLTLHKPEGTRQVGTSTLRWLYSVEGGLQTIRGTNQRWKSQDRNQCRSIVKEAKVQHGL
jgi:hypothetical protein